MANLPPPPSGFKLDEASAPPLPKGYTFDKQETPKVEPEGTTVGGMAASIGRGIAPVAAGAGTGALVGAALGAPFGGVGAVPGAIAGAGSEMATQLLGDVYNRFAKHFDWPEVATPQDMTDKVLDAIGVKRPSTTAEHLAEETAGGLATAATGMMPTHQLSEAIVKNSAEDAEKAIQKAYTKTIKPADKGTSQALDKYNRQTQGAINSIVDNKRALVFEDGSIIGELPKTLEQFNDAIEQTKSALFQKYDALAKQTQSAGIDVSLTPVVNELQKLANDPVTSLTHPELVAYAKERANTFGKISQLSATDAQRTIANLNASLKSFYRNPTYEVTARAGVDAMMANQIRAALDKTVETAVGPGYQGLKNEYGNLSAIQKDVLKRAQQDAKKGAGLSGRLADVFSAEEIIRGVATLDPHAIVRGTALRGAAQYIKWLRDPNRAVEKFFEEAERQKQATQLPATQWTSMMNAP